MPEGSGAGVSPSSRTWTPEPFPAITAPEGSGTGGIHELCAPEPPTVPVAASVTGTCPGGMPEHPHLYNPLW